MFVMRASLCIIVNNVIMKAIIHRFVFASVSGHASVTSYYFHEFGSKHITDDTIDFIFHEIFH